MRDQEDKAIKSIVPYFLVATKSGETFSDASCNFY